MLGMKTSPAAGRLTQVREPTLREELRRRGIESTGEERMRKRMVSRARREREKGRFGPSGAGPQSAQVAGAPPSLPARSASPWPRVRA